MHSVNSRSLLAVIVSITLGAALMNGCSNSQQSEPPPTPGVVKGPPPGITPPPAGENVPKKSDEK